ncbi:UvrB/UvrC motif-containing protein [Halobacillus sp. A1]|uniref:UvrB/UvrC motif-containing protein n=1 Tax=Halobacillus sp. A1 TaxID=2880262 RepID=UPI0020A620DF|nr:UvrB/UvrC motif-containing protein [Halobacillus sp. A1]MCP3033244.1 UvrB/UvrC motif-containing protein [Halobacillus sp. A1]
MDCQRCHKRPATVHLTQVINGEKTEVHVCAYCAKEQGYMSDNQDFTLNDLLSGLFNYDKSSSYKGKQSKSHQSNKQLKCPACGLTYQEFAQVGKFGCADCYKTFDDRLNPIFRRVHSGNIKHDGKIPKREGGNLHLKKQMNEYKTQLQNLIEQEEFEEAAKIRDQIRSLDEQIHHGQGGEE